MSMKTTITEALADIKTSLARIDKKRQAILAMLGRDSRLRDPMEAEGGSKEFVRRERQAIGDLEEKIVRIRSSIQAANLATRLNIEGRERTLSEWLNWRREVADGHGKFLSAIAANLAQARQQAATQGQQVREGDGSGSPQGDLIVNLSEAALSAEIESLTSVLGQLDGKLSLLNATTTIEV